jgi:hypothetical protein
LLTGAGHSLPLFDCRRWGVFLGGCCGFLLVGFHFGIGLVIGDFPLHDATDLGCRESATARTVSRVHIAAPEITTRMAGMIALPSRSVSSRAG